MKSRKAQPTLDAPTAERRSEVTQLLLRAEQGDRDATDRLFPLVYDELRRLAGGMMRQERASHTLQATALVHEAYFRLVGDTHAGWESRAHFFGAAAAAIRRILVDHARSKNRDKRGGGWDRVPLPDEAAEQTPTLDLLALDEALRKLATADPRMARLVELRFFVGLTITEAAASLGISEPTAVREWQLARVWLHAELSSEGPDGR
ncbi:MAG: hypothetical protein IT431_01635 [Phycisphaerales bacterium]|nr:hypothetical protein [Phycisphaerales bacterium]